MDTPAVFTFPEIIPQKRLPKVCFKNFHPSVDFSFHPFLFQLEPLLKRKNLTMLAGRLLASLAGFWLTKTLEISPTNRQKQRQPYPRFLLSWNP